MLCNLSDSFQYNYIVQNIKSSIEQFSKKSSVKKFYEQLNEQKPDVSSILPAQEEIKPTPAPKPTGIKK